MNFIEKARFKDSKYVYLYKFMSDDEKALDIFRQSTLYFNQPNFFNDPFDCRFSFDTNHKLTMKEINEGLKANNIQKISISERFRLRTKAQIRMSKGKFFEDILNKTNESLYITCFSQNPLNLLMWSHYANKHKGYLVEFRFPIYESLLYSFGMDNNFIPFPVTYSSDYPKITNEEKKDPYHSLHKMILNKSLDWEYEQEFRIIRRGKHLSNIQKFPSKIVISSVILGINMEENFKDKLIEALRIFDNKMTIPIFNAKKQEDKYAIYIPKHNFLDIKR